MSIEKVRAYLEERQLADRIQEFDVSSATVELAAQALHVEGQRIAKTLSFHVGDRVALIVAAGAAKIANPKYKAQFNTKAKMCIRDRYYIIRRPMLYMMCLTEKQITAAIDAVKALGTYTLSGNAAYQEMQISGLMYVHSCLLDTSVIRVV